MYLALYRKYRPQNFEEVIGQDRVVRTLKNQIKNGKIGHAYLFCGSRGTGKTSTAKIFSRAINCEHPVDGSPWKCETCKILQNSNIDILEIDAASNNGVDEIRDLREKVKYPPVNGKYKVYIIDEVHMLSPSAFNALLKTLEEPPSYAVFILATTEVHKIPATILSRLMRFDFSLVSVDELMKLLQRVFKEENIAAEKEAIEMIARAGDGSVRDTLSVADRCVSYSGSELTYKSVVDVLGTTEKEELCNIASALLSNSLGESLKELDKVLSQGKSPLVLSKDLISYFRDLLIILCLGADAKKMVVAREDLFEKMSSQAIEDNYNKIVSAISTLSEVEAELRYSISPRIVLETAFVKTLNNVGLMERVTELEKEVKLLKSGAAIVQTTEQKKPTMSNPEQKEPEKVPEANEENESGMQLLGKLLTYLREKKEMSVLSCIRQVKRVEFENSLATFFMEDQMTIDILLRDKNRQIISEFFGDRGLKYCFKVENPKSKMGNENELRDAFGGRLEVKE